MANLTAGWLMFWILLVHTAMITVPVVAEAYRQPIDYQHICPMLQIRHGVGSDLRTFTRVKDLCADG